MPALDAPDPPLLQPYRPAVTERLIAAGVVGIVLANGWAAVQYTSSGLWKMTLLMVVVDVAIVLVWCRAVRGSDAPHLLLADERWVEEPKSPRWGRYPVRWNLDDVPWSEAPIPARRHRCRPQTVGQISRSEFVYLCACGGSRNPVYPGWLERNTADGERPERDEPWSVRKQRAIDEAEQERAATLRSVQH